MEPWEEARRVLKREVRRVKNWSGEVSLWGVWEAGKFTSSMVRWGSDIALIVIHALFSGAELVKYARI